jgi:hypothetical protein
MSQENTVQSEKPIEENNGNAELVKMKEKNKALEEKLEAAEQKAQMAKNEVRNIHYIHRYVTVRIDYHKEKVRKI